jgi:hypothetical protein
VLPAHKSGFTARRAKLIVFDAGLGQWQTAAFVKRMTGVRFTAPAPKTIRRSSSVVEQRFRKAQVAGSIPAFGSKEERHAGGNPAGLRAVS